MKKQSPKQAINAKCKECIYDEHNGGTWREQTENCAVKTCSLYEHRPLTLATKRKISEERFESMTEIEKSDVLAKKLSAKKRMQEFHSQSYR